jgi:hypothetical protein
MKIGDRVRIDCPHSNMDGAEAVIWDIAEGVYMYSNGKVVGPTAAYDVDVVGFGRFSVGGLRRSFRRQYLKPIQPLGSWEELSRILGKDIRQREPA